jgi:hypothetical protein
MPVIYHPFFDCLRIVTCHTVEASAANSIPLFTQDRNSLRRSSALRRSSWLAPPTIRSRKSLTSYTIPSATRRSCADREVWPRNTRTRQVPGADRNCDELRRPRDTYLPRAIKELGHD